LIDLRFHNYFFSMMFIDINDTFIILLHYDELLRLKNLTLGAQNSIQYSR
jgi:hypothetical protein